MDACIVTPAPFASRTGNRITAIRWGAMLRSLGHRVRLQDAWDGGPCDLLVALHAERSADSIRRFRARGRGSLLVALTGTDVYRDCLGAVIESSLDTADGLIVLQELALDRLAPAWRRKAYVIPQSTTPLTPAPERSGPGFPVAVVGHLRAVKVPFLTAEASRRLPPESNLEVLHVGRILDADLHTRVRAEQDQNRRYRFLGELSRRRTKEIIGRSRLLVLTSVMEGGANVISEAIVAGTPVLSTRISGSEGLLGSGYPGFFPVGDVDALSGLLWRAESEPEFRSSLASWCAKLADRFCPARERDAWDRVLDGLPA